jgi:hypothetical protein
MVSCAFVIGGRADANANKTQRADFGVNLIAYLFGKGVREFPAKLSDYHRVMA